MAGHYLIQARVHNLFRGIGNKTVRTFQWGCCNIFKNILPLKTLKKPPSKVAHNRPQTFFFMYWLAAQTSPELIFHVINMSQDTSVLLSVVTTQKPGTLFSLLDISKPLWPHVGNICLAAAWLRDSTFGLFWGASEGI